MLILCICYFYFFYTFDAGDMWMAFLNMTQQWQKWCPMQTHILTCTLHSHVVNTIIIQVGHQAEQLPNTTNNHSCPLYAFHEDCFAEISFWKWKWFCRLYLYNIIFLSLWKLLYTYTGFSIMELLGLCRSWLSEKRERKFLSFES